MMVVAVGQGFDYATIGDTSSRAAIDHSDKLAAQRV